eukprot:1240575-Amphidinium_carterae.1
MQAPRAQPATRPLSESASLPLISSSQPSTASRKSDKECRVCGRARVSCEPLSEAHTKTNLTKSAWRGRAHLIRRSDQEQVPLGSTVMRRASVGSPSSTTRNKVGSCCSICAGVWFG